MRIDTQTREYLVGRTVRTSLWCSGFALVFGISSVVVYGLRDTLSTGLSSALTGAMSTLFLVYLPATVVGILTGLVSLRAAPAGRLRRRASIGLGTGILSLVVIPLGRAVFGLA